MKPERGDFAGIIPPEKVVAGRTGVMSREGGICYICLCPLAKGDRYGMAPLRADDPMLGGPCGYPGCGCTIREAMAHESCVVPGVGGAG